MVAKPDEVKQIATQVVTAGVMRVIATVVDPQTAAKKLVDDVKEFPAKAAGKAAELPLKVLGQAMELQQELPKLAAGLPLKLALQAVATGEKVRALLPGHSGPAAPAIEEKASDGRPSGAAAWDAAAPEPSPEDYTPPVAGGHTAQAAKVTRAELKAVPDPVATPAKKVAAKKAPAPAKDTRAKVTPAAAKSAPASSAPAKSAPTASAPTTSAAKAPAPTKATTATTAAKAPAKAPSKAAKAVKAAAAAAPVPVSAATEKLLDPLTDTPTPTPAPAEAAPVATVTPIHAGRDGHVDTALPATVEAAVGAATDGAALKADELPLADYGSLSITQIRSRISKLDAVALVQLRDYERAHADRTPIVTLLETKLAKVTATTVDTASTVSSSAPGETAALIAEAPSSN